MSKQPMDGQDLPSTVQSLVDAARQKQRIGDYEEARIFYERALRRLRSSDHASAASALLRWIGSTFVDEGDGDAARDCYEVSLVVAELNGDQVNTAHALNNFGAFEWRLGRLEEAETCYHKARIIASTIGELRLLAMIDQNMGVLANIRGDLDSALHHYQESLAVFRQIGEQDRIGAVLNNIGMLYTDMRRWADAESVFSEGAALCDKYGDLRTRQLVEGNRTELFIEQGDYARARESCDVAFELASRLDYQLAIGEVYKNYGIIYRHTGKLNLAETHLKNAANIAERYSHPLLAGEVSRELARVYRALDRNQEALEALNHAHRVFTSLRAQPDLEDVGQLITDLETMFLDVVRRWGESIESKDLYTAGHCERVADYSCMLAEAVGFDQQTLTWFRMGAFLHDVGKTVVPAEILNKDGKLSAEEWETMRRHTVAGVDLVSHLEFPWDPRPMIRSHHERWDGTGYPDGLSGEDIPITARILCVADVFDALTTTRAYRRAYSAAEALEIMRRDSGRIFDPALFDLFESLITPRIAAGNLTEASTDKTRAGTR